MKVYQVSIFWQKGCIYSLPPLSEYEHHHMFTAVWDWQCLTCPEICRWNYLSIEYFIFLTFIIVLFVRFYRLSVILIRTNENLTKLFTVTTQGQAIKRTDILELIRYPGIAMTQFPSCNIWKRRDSNPRSLAEFSNHYTKLALI